MDTPLYAIPGRCCCSGSSHFVQYILPPTPGVLSDLERSQGPTIDRQFEAAAGILHLRDTWITPTEPYVFCLHWTFDPPAEGD
ncbi:hypothetical protein SUGI_1497980 [Cryptomeria japonica]|uniref:Uncharacterized protein n=1 Tax=Cryptomeria japonica TaxID=3369 RepID=A0AAD3RRY4_CRYJA|nr:hypothetical protein SUGI_1497980 [Cryptomeria japonica]